MSITNYNYLYNLINSQTAAVNKEKVENPSGGVSLGISGASWASAVVSNASQISGINIDDYNWISTAVDCPSGVRVGTAEDLSVGQIINMFIRGDLEWGEAYKGLKANGAKNIGYMDFHTSLAFQYNGKDYVIRCSQSAVKSQIDDDRAVTYTYEQIRQKLCSKVQGVDVDKVIETYFYEALVVDDKVLSYSLNDKFGFKTIEEVINAYSKYKNQLIIDNFLADMNRKSDDVDDLNNYKGKNIHFDEYLYYVDLINVSTGKEKTEEKNKVVEKLVEDFTQGNLAIDEVKVILSAIGATGIKINTSTSGLYVVSFKLNGIQYCLRCNVNDAASGTDKSNVKAFTNEEISKFPKAFVDQFFDCTAVIGGKCKTWALKEGITLEDLKQGYIEYVNKLKDVNAKTNQVNIADLASSGANSQDLRDALNNMQSFDYSPYIEAFAIIAGHSLQEKYTIDNSYLNNVTDYISKTMSFSSNSNAETIYNNIETEFEELCKPIDVNDLFSYSRTYSVGLRTPDGKFVYESGKVVYTSETIDVNLIKDGKVDPFTFYDNIYIILSSTAEAPAQLKYMAYVLESKISELGLNEREAQAFVCKIFDKIKKYNIDNMPILKDQTSERYGFETWSSGNKNGIIADEFTELVENMGSTVKKSSPDGYRTVQEEIMFNSYNGSISINQIYGMLLSPDYQLREFANAILDGIDDWKRFIGGKLGIAISEEDMLKVLITQIDNQLTGKLANVRDKVYGKLSDAAINKFSNLFAYMNDGTTRINQILSTNNKDILYQMLAACGNGVVDEFCQGRTGDCWLLSALKALSSSPAGKQIISNQIQWADNLSCVTVYFAGVEKNITISIEEIVDAIYEGRLSSGDVDVLVIELAMQKVYGDINGDYEKTFWNYFIKNGKIETSKPKGDSNGIKNWLNKLLQQKNAGKHFAASFSLRNGCKGASNGDGTTNFSWQCTDGSKGSCNLSGGHAFAITDITANTISFVNPWYGDIVYTVSWSEFMNLGAYDFEMVSF